MSFLFVSKFAAKYWLAKETLGDSLINNHPIVHYPKSTHIPPAVALILKDVASGWQKDPPRTALLFFFYFQVNKVCPFY